MSPENLSASRQSLVFVLGIDREHCALLAPLFVLATEKRAQMFQVQLWGLQPCLQ